MVHQNLGDLHAARAVVVCCQSDTLNGIKSFEKYGVQWNLWEALYYTLW